MEEEWASEQSEQRITRIRGKIMFWKEEKNNEECEKKKIKYSGKKSVMEVKNEKKKESAQAKEGEREKKAENDVITMFCTEEKYNGGGEGKREETVKEC